MRRALDLTVLLAVIAVGLWVLRPTPEAPSPPMADLAARKVPRLEKPEPEPVPNVRLQRLGSGPLTMFGVELGDTQAEMEAAARRFDLKARSQFYYNSSARRHAQFTFHLDEASGRVGTLEGQVVHQGGKIVLATGDSQERVIQLLGQPSQRVKAADTKPWRDARSGPPPPRFYWTYPQLKLEITICKGKVMEFNLGKPCRWACHC